MNYSPYDKILAAIEFYKMWLDENKISVAPKTPISVIELKYGKKLREDLGVSEWFNLERVGDYILDKKLFSYAHIVDQKMLSEFSPKLFSKLLPEINLDGLTVKLIEDSPRNFRIISEYNPEVWFKNKDITQKDVDYIKNLEKIVTSRIEKYVGLERGEPYQGNFYNWGGHGSFFSNLPEFEKYINKVVKPQLKSADDKSQIRGFKIDLTKQGKLRIKIIWASGFRRSVTKEELLDKLMELGFNPQLIVLD
jgi:hypothetical protein